MAKPFIRKTGFWADGINGFLLRPPYRTYTKTPATSVQEQAQEAPLDTPEQEQAQEAPPATPEQEQAQEAPPATHPEHEEGVDTAELTRALQEHFKSLVEENPQANSAAQPNIDIHPRGGQQLPAQKWSAVRATIAGINPPPGFPVKLWEHSLTVPTIEEFTQTLDSLPAYITEALQPDTLFSSERLRKYGFKDKEPEILRSVVMGLERGVIATMTGTNREHVRDVLNRAYDTFGVSNPQGLHTAVCWLATKEAEGIARSVRQKFEKDVLNADIVSEDVSGSAKGERKNRPTVSHVSESESEARNRPYME